MHEDTNPGTRSPSAADQVRQAAKEHAGTLLKDAKDTARSKLGEHKHTAASGLGEVASALRTSARDSIRECGWPATARGPDATTPPCTSALCVSWTAVDSCPRCCAPSCAWRW